VSLAPSAVESAPVVQRPRGWARSAAPWLVLCCYLAGAVVLTWRLWADPASRAQAGDPEDVDLFVWFMRYAATAVAHGHLPALVTTAMNTPQGINVMWNTSFLLPGVVLSPVTLLFGPQVSLTIALTLGFAGSAASLFWVLRRWGASVWPAALGGALYGFSPALVNSAVGHYHVQFAVLPPLIIDAALRIVTGRGRPVSNGVWLGLLVAAQVFTGEELLTLTAVAGVVLVAVLAASRPRSVLRRAGGTLVGLVTGAGVALAITGYALWAQFHGPLSEHGSPWATANFRNQAVDLVTPAGNMLIHRGASTVAVGAGLPEYLAYLGWPLLVVLVAATIRYWRDLRVRVTAVTWAVLELFSLGGDSRFLPWHWLQGLPVLGQVLPDRFAVVADGAAAAALAFSLHLALSAAPEGSGWARRTWPFAVAVLVLLPLIPLSMQAAPASPVPAGWRAAFAELGPDARVLVIPIPTSRTPDPMRWQADTGEPGSLIGGWFVGPDQNGQAIVENYGPVTADNVAVQVNNVARYLNALWAGTPTYNGINYAQIDVARGYWRPTAIIAVTSPHMRFEQVLVKVFGRPDFRVGQLLVWRL
jgi:hypothetical protein